MACDVVESTGALFTLWGRPTKDDVDRIVEALRRAMERYGKPVVYVTRVPDGAPPPDPAIQQYIGAMMPRVLSYCSTYHVVLEGDGFVAALKRGVLLTLFRFGKRRGTFFVHESCDDVISAVSSDRQANVVALLRRAQDRGLLVGGPVTTLAPTRRMSSSRATS